MLAYAFSQCFIVEKQKKRLIQCLGTINTFACNIFTTDETINVEKKTISAKTSKKRFAEQKN